MKHLLLILLLILPLGAYGKTFEVPEGFEIQVLDPTDGRIAKPQGWFFTSKGTKDGWLWTLSKEEQVNGYYETGMRIQMVVGVSGNSISKKEQLVSRFVQDKLDSVKILKNCEKENLGQFFRKCLETKEKIKTPNGFKDYRILYSIFWAKEMDMIVISTFGTLPEKWKKLSYTIDTMSAFRIIGPNFGK